jgi:hypothetical protein
VQFYVINFSFSTVQELGSSAVGVYIEFPHLTSDFAIRFCHQKITIELNIKIKIEHSEMIRHLPLPTLAQSCILTTVRRAPCTHSCNARREFLHLGESFDSFERSVTCQTQSLSSWGERQTQSHCSISSVRFPLFDSEEIKSL